MPSAKAQRLQIYYRDYIAVVSLSRAEMANALDLPAWREIRSVFKQLNTNPQVRVIILRGEGKHFCSGIDLSVFADLLSVDAESGRKSEALRQFILDLQADLTAIEQCSKPVLVAVHGACIGAGLDMICCADMRYASADARFCVKEVDLAITADVGTLQRLPKLIADGVARELAYTARTIDAQEAQQLGLINRVFADENELEREVFKIAGQIAAKSPLAIRGTKEMLVYTRDHSVADGLRYVATWNAGMLSEVDVSEAIRASMTAEPPKFLD